MTLSHSILKDESSRLRHGRIVRELNSDKKTCLIAAGTKDV